MESSRRALSRGGLRKNAESKKHAQKSEEKTVVSGVHCVSDQTLKQGSNRFTIGQPRVSGFGLKCAGILSARFCWEISAFFPVSLTSVTLVKKMAQVISGSRPSRGPQASKKKSKTWVAI